MKIVILFLNLRHCISDGTTMERRISCMFEYLTRQLMSITASPIGHRPKEGLENLGGQRRIFQHINERNEMRKLIKAQNI